MKKPVFVTLPLILSGLLVSPLLSAATPVPVVEMTPGGAQQSAGAARSVAQPAAVPQQVLQARAEAGRYTQLFLQIQQLQEEVSYLRGQVEEQRYEMKRMRDDARDRYRDLDRRLSNLNQTAAPLPEPASALSTVSPVAVQPVPAPIPAPRLGDQKAYEDAFALVRQKSFDQAVASFSRFLALYPESKLLPNVYYWTGEVHRAKNPADPAAAKEAFSQVVQRFPEHPKAADAYYKLGLTLVDLGERAKAAETMNIVLTQYPEAASARLAADFLARN